MTVEGILQNASPANTLAEFNLVDAVGAVTTINDNEVTGGRSKTVDDVWREIVAGRREKTECKQEVEENGEMMTLEEFLERADAAEDETVMVEQVPVRLSGGMFAINQSQTGNIVSEEGVLRLGNGVEEIGGGRGKKRALLEPLDKAAQQRQRRMIKNRESAARSRERKQAYQIELESMTFKLEEENELLLKEKAQRTKERFKQLMENIIPVVVKRRPQRVLRRVRSTQW